MAGAGGRRSKPPPPPKAVRLSQMYSFSCVRPPSDAPAAVATGGGGGYLREVCCNEPGCTEAMERGYQGNYVSTTKYTVANFLPKSLFEQFRRVANLYFLVASAVSFSPLAPFRAVSVALPLIVVVGITMAKEAVEDWRRKQQDIEVNNRKSSVYGLDQTFQPTEWKKLRVGDVVMVEKDEFFPADLILLSSSYDDGICYVETMNLDGETNLKLKQCLELTSALNDAHVFWKFKAKINCEDPNENLYSFVGTMHYEGRQYPLSPQQLLLRDSKLRNTPFIYGVVVFTGHDTKVMQNAMNPPSKRSKVEKKMDKIIYVLFAFLFLIAFVGSLFFGFETKRDINDGESKRWYLRPDDSAVYFDPNRASLAAFLHFMTCLMLYGALIPISLYISIEIVKVLQSTFINQDQEMYYEETDKPARARTSNLNEELGQVDTILSDKTGTLTCNSMEFIKCSIAGIAYGNELSEVEKAVKRSLNSTESEFSNPASIMDHTCDNSNSRRSVKGFNFNDKRLLDGNWVNEPHLGIVQMFFRVLAVCHTVIPEQKDISDVVSYKVESPDEAAFVIASREIGFEFYERTQTSITLCEFDPKTGGKVDRSYELLNILEFSSFRKRMSVIIRNDEGRLLLLCKGADSAMFKRLSKDGRSFETETSNHINNYSQAGLRTLVIAYRELAEEEYKIWLSEFLKAKNSICDDRDSMVDAVAEKIETDLILLGSTAVEDKLQNGVSECIDKLAQAGIKIWVLTGDKLETAVNIGYACSLLRKDMKLIMITLDTPDIIALEKQGNKDAIMKISCESIAKQIYEANDQVISEKGSSMGFALIIDGKSLAFALMENLESSFLELAIGCASVICCRTSPKQKALVTRLVKKGTKKTTLAIGDGANDVGMLQEADIGVGINGVEGMQAVMSSDFAIAQFCFLERLLLVHGHWCYRRIAAMICYFFYKNITFGVTLFWFEAYASFSAQPAYNDWYIAFYSVMFTSLPVIALGIFDKDLSAQLCLKFPLLHQDGVKNNFFSWSRILGWMFNAICSSTIIFYLTASSILPQAFQKHGRVAGSELLGITMYTAVVWTVNCQMALYLSYVTWIQVLFIWGSIMAWYLFLIVYGSIPPSISTTAYQVFLEVCVSSPLYWLATLSVVVSALLPYFSYSAFQKTFFPTSYNVIQRLQSDTL